MQNKDSKKDTNNLLKTTIIIFLFISTLIVSIFLYNLSIFERNFKIQMEDYINNDGYIYNDVYSYISKSNGMNEEFVILPKNEFPSIYNQLGADKVDIYAKLNNDYIDIFILKNEGGR